MEEIKEKPKKKKKKLSWTKKLKSLRDYTDYLSGRNDELRDEICNLQNELREIAGLIQKKYFKVKFKIKAKNEEIYEYEEIKKAYSLDGAIRLIKLNKIHPSSFELIDVKILG